jgi:hypothetical protein
MRPSFHVEPDDVLYFGDVDLSSFGPYYGDAWSSLEDFERTLAMVEGIEARWYATFHHVGVLDGAGGVPREARALQRGDRGARVPPARVPRHAAHPGRDRGAPLRLPAGRSGSRRRTMGQHLARLARAGRVREVEAGRYLAAP